MRRTLCTAVLVLAFCCPVSAGVIHNPAPTATPTEGTVLEPNEAETPVVETTEPGASYGLTEVTFDLLAVLPTLL